MKILFDECVPQRLRRLLPNHSVTTAPEMGWSGIKNGELLRLASNQFDVFVTVDRNLSFQQSSTTLPLPVIVMQSTSNRLSDLEPLIPQLVILLTDTLTKKTYLLV